MCCWHPHRSQSPAAEMLWHRRGLRRLLANNLLLSYKLISEKLLWKKKFQLLKKVIAKLSLVMLPPHLLWILSHQLQTHDHSDAGPGPVGNGVCASGDGRRLRCKSGSHSCCSRCDDGWLSRQMSGCRVGHGWACWTFRRCCLISRCCGGLYSLHGGCRSYASSCHLGIWRCVFYGCVCGCCCHFCAHMCASLLGWGHRMYGCVLHCSCNRFHCLTCSLAPCSRGVCWCCRYHCGRFLACHLYGGCSCLGCCVGAWCCGYLVLVCCLHSCSLAQGCCFKRGCAVKINCGALMGWRMKRGQWLSRSSCIVEGCGFWRQFDPQGHFRNAGRECCKEANKSVVYKPLYLTFLLIPTI